MAVLLVGWRRRDAASAQKGEGPYLGGEHFLSSSGCEEAQVPRPPSYWVFALLLA